MSVIFCIIIFILLFPPVAVAVLPVVGGRLTNGEASRIPPVAVTALDAGPGTVLRGGLIAAPTPPVEFAVVVLPIGALTRLAPGGRVSCRRGGLTPSDPLGNSGVTLGGMTRRIGGGASTPGLAAVGFLNPNSVLVGRCGVVGVGLLPIGIV